MVRGSGATRFNGIAVGEVEINLLGPSIHLKAIYAFVNVDSGERFGRGTKEGNWSQETIDRFLAFLQSAENDICNDVYETGPTTTLPIETDDQGIKSL